MMGLRQMGLMCDTRNVPKVECPPVSPFEKRQHRIIDAQTKCLQPHMVTLHLDVLLFFCFQTTAFRTPLLPWPSSAAAPPEVCIKVSLGP